MHTKDYTDNAQVDEDTDANSMMPMSMLHMLSMPKNTFENCSKNTDRARERECLTETETETETKQIGYKKMIAMSTNF